MNTMNATGNLTTRPSPTGGKNMVLSPATRQVLFSIVSFFSIFGNLLVLAFMYKKRKSLLKKNGYFLMSILALCDVITGVFIFLCPDHVFIEPIFEPDSGLALRLYCEFAYSRTLIFSLGSVSVYICLLVTIDRWVAVVMPTKYRHTMTKPRLLLALAFCAILVFTTTFLGKNQSLTFPNNPPGKKCSSKNTPTFIPAESARVFAFIATVIRTLAPTVLILGLYIHMLYKYKNASSVTQSHGSAARKKLTQVAVATSLAIVICWMPNQVNYFLYKLRVITTLRSPFAELSGVLAMFNSAVSPFIYGFVSNEFRQGYLEVLLSLCAWIPGLEARHNRAVKPSGEGASKSHDITEKDTVEERDSRV